MPIDEQQAEEARKNMAEFLKLILDFLRDLAHGDTLDEEGKSFFMEEMQVEIKNAWHEFDGDFDLEVALGRIRELRAEAIERHGLYGAQWRAKNKVITVLRSSFTARPVKKILLKLLGAVDVALDSLLAVAGIDGALREIKEVLMSSIDD